MACSAHEAMRNFKGQSLRTLAIGVLQTVRPSLVPQLLERLRKASRTWWCRSTSCRGWRSSGACSTALDIGISYLPPRQPGLHGLLLYEDELQLVIPDTHPLKDFKKVSIRQAAELPMLMLGEEFQIRQIWQAQLASQGRGRRCRQR
jgi:DNA-binding transcriptional LysR family regulator